MIQEASLGETAEPNGVVRSQWGQKDLAPVRLPHVDALVGASNVCSLP
jgi:hypothetical protein